MLDPEKIINFTKDELESFIEDENSCIRINNSTYSLALYPYHLMNVSESIKRLLNAKVAKYDQRLDGIILGYKNLKLLTPYAALKADSCYIHVDIQGDFYIFKPKVGKKLTGVVNKTSSNHIGCLVHKVFNVSVPNKNKNENEGWAGFNVQIGNIIELSVTEIQLDARLPYIQASIVKTKFKNNSIAIETENKKIDTPKKQKNKKKDLNQTIDVVDNRIELLLESAKKPKKRHSTQTENHVEETPILNDSTKNQKKKRHSKSTENNLEETPNLNDSTKKQKKKRNSELTENIETTAENINESLKKQKKRHSKQSENNNVEPSPEKKKNRHSDILDNIKFEKFSQNTLILNESLKKQKKKRQSLDESNNLEINKVTPKKQDTNIPSNSQRTNESDYFATPKMRKKRKPSETEISDTILEKDSLEDFAPKEKKSKTDSSKKKKNKHNDEIETNLEVSKTDASKKKKNKQNVEIETNSEVSKTDSSKKKKNKQNDAVDANLELTEQLQTLKEQKKEKKRKSKELKLEQIPINVSPVKPMADLEDRKIKKRLQSLSQTVDWKNKELNLYDSDLEKTLNTPSDNQYLLEKSLEFNLAKIEALNANTPRKRKRRHDTDEDFISHKKKSKMEED